MFNRRIILKAASALAATYPVRGAFAQSTYPSRPIQLIVGAAPGGSSDVFARQISEELGKGLGQPVIVVNKPGSGGVIAIIETLKAPADGYTLAQTWIGNATSHSLVPNLPYDINRDFVHMTQVISGANVLVANPKTGFKSLADMVQFAKKNPGKLNYASSGNGTSGHLATEMLKQRAGISMLHIPYRGGAQALTDLLAGQVDVMFINQDIILNPVSTGKLNALAISSPQRSRLQPALPTVAELGYPGYEATAWAGLSARKGTPQAILDQVQAAMIKALQGPLRAKLEATGGTVIGTNQAQFTEFVQRETDTWAKVIKTAGIKLG